MPRRIRAGFILFHRIENHAATIPTHSYSVLAIHRPISPEEGLMFVPHEAAKQIIVQGTEAQVGKIWFRPMFGRGGSREPKKGKFALNFYPWGHNDVLMEQVSPIGSVLTLEQRGMLEGKRLAARLELLAYRDLKKKEGNVLIYDQSSWDRKKMRKKMGRGYRKYAYARPIQKEITKLQKYFKKKRVLP